MDSNYDFYQICADTERSDEAIKYAINDIPILKPLFIYLYPLSKSDLGWLSNMEKWSKREWDKDSLTKKGRFYIKGNKINITHLFHCYKLFLKVHWIFDHFI